MFAGEDLKLRRDGTFTYMSSTDLIGDECEARGTWQRESRNKVDYLVLDVQEVNPRGQWGSNCGVVTQHRYWAVTHEGVVSDAGYVIPRARKGNW